MGIAGRFDEICVLCVRAAAPVKSDAQSQCSFVVYTTLDQFQPEQKMNFEEAAVAPPAVIGDLPIAGVARAVLDIQAVARVRRAVRRGEPAPEGSWQRVVRDPDQYLDKVLDGIRSSEKFLRVWWFCTDSELTAFPWEAILPAPRHFTFVRGKPPATVAPRVPIKGKPKLALIYDQATAPPELIDAFKSIRGMEVACMGGASALEDLRKAAVSGGEIVHIVGRATVSFANEGMLALPPTNAGRPWPNQFLLGLYSLLRPITNKAVQTWISQKFGIDLEAAICPAAQLSDMLRGSRVTILGLSPPRDSPDMQAWMTGLLPSTYRAFSALGSSLAPLPTIVAPLGSLAQQEAKFWPAFYEALAETCAVEEAASQALAGAPNLPVALFLRHRLRKQFVKEAQLPSVDPAIAAAQIATADQWLTQLKAVAAVYGDERRDLFDQQQEQLNQRRTELQPYLEPEASE
jgi:hypothetical protein